MATEQVVEGLEEAAEGASQYFRSVPVKYFLGGVALGAALGFYYGYRFNREKLRAEAYEESKAEVEKIREIYATEQTRAKPPLEEIVEEKGYEVEEIDTTPARPLAPPVPVQEPEARIQYDKSEREQDQGWDYTKEIPKRNKNHPYVIHQDEFNEKNNDYTQLTWTYYAADNILLDEHDEVVVRPELTVGEMNLKRFGHGSDDADVVFVRNDRIEIEWEICRTLKSYEVEILGYDGPESGIDNDDAT